MDEKIRQYADSVYERALHQSASLLRDQRVTSQREMAARRGNAQLPLSGFEVQATTKLFVEHIERCMEARFESYRKAYGEAKQDPTEEEFSGILTSVRETQKLQVEHSARAIRDFMKSRGLDGDVTEALNANSGYGHDRILGDWKVWRAQVNLTKAAATNDRKFARMAIEEARKSVPENDGRPHPLVGAVVVKDGQVLAVAHRGEAEGNHAEYTALEKRLSDAAVAGSTVYTTLEPCTTRNHPKIPCAQRLIERKVGRVVMGMLDPDARITGRGQRKLRSANIITDFFPHDLMAEVEDLNREFTRALESPSKSTESPQPVLEPPVVPGSTRAVGRLRRHRESAVDKLENVRDFGLVEIACCPASAVELPVPGLEAFVQQNRFEFSEEMQHFPAIDVFQNGVSVGYFPRAIRDDIKSTVRFTFYKDAFVVFDALADPLMGGPESLGRNKAALHAGWLSYELQRHLQLTKSLLKDSDVRSIFIVVHLENAGSLPLIFPSGRGPWVEQSEYAGPHEPITRLLAVSEIHDHDGDKRNSVMPIVVDVMGEVYRIFGLSRVLGLWDENGNLTYVKGLENQR